MMWLWFIISFTISIALTALVRYVGLRLNIVDAPDATRKRHAGSVPLLGGTALFVAFWSVIACVLYFHPILGIELLKTKLLAAFIGSLLLLIIGVADEVKSCSDELRNEIARPHPTLSFVKERGDHTSSFTKEEAGGGLAGQIFSPKLRLLLTLFAIGVAVYVSGGLQKITNPLGGFFLLSNLAGSAIIFVWLTGMTFTTKILDGLDGLATGIVAIGALMIYGLTASAKFYQPNVGLVALVLAGTCLGFLLFNFHPAKIFLGESGSLFVGFMLGVLAVVGGGKLATALLVMAVPILDLARVMYVRHKRGQAIMQGDREHLHFKLLDRGWSERNVVILYYVVAAAFGTTTLFLQSYQKIIALVFLVIAMIAVSWKFNLYAFPQRKK